MTFFTGRSWKGFLPFCFAAIFILGGDLVRAEPNVQRAKVALVNIGPHELINQIIDGFNAEIGQDKGIEIILRDASGDKSLIASAVSGALAARPKVMAPITTPVAQAALKSAPADLPVVFLGITDPIGAGLIDSLDHPVRSTGVSDLAPFEAILRFIRTITPNVKKVGMPFSPDEQPAVFGRDQVLKLAPQFGLTIDARPVENKDEFATLLRQLLSENDALLIGSDNGMFDASPQIVKAALNAGKPVFAGDSTSIQNGALGGYTINYRDVGREGARLVARVLRGEKAGQIPVVVMKEGVLEINANSAAQLGITIPPQMMEAATKVIR